MIARAGAEVPFGKAAALLADLAGVTVSARTIERSAGASGAAARFRSLGMFTGSGAIEGGIKAIVVQRAKQSGMHWTTEGAADIITLRCQHASGRWDEPWPAGTTRPAALRAAI
jgi:hypothetical protein